MIEQELKQILQNKFPDDDIQIVNQSHLHAGHTSSPETGQSHFEVTITSNLFKNLSRVQMHTMVLDACKPLFCQGLHALSLHTYVKK